MKKLLALSLIAVAVVASAMTYDEGRAFINAHKSVSTLITPADIQSGAAAALAITNYSYLSSIRNAGLITHQQVAELINGKIGFERGMTSNANVSSNAAIQAQAFTTLLDMAVASPATDYIATAALANLVNHSFAGSTAKRIEAFEALSVAGKTQKSIFMLLNKVPNGLFTSKTFDSNYTPEFKSYVDSKIEGLFNAWLALAPTVIDAEKGIYVDFYFEGGDVTRYYMAVKDTAKMKQMLQKTVAYAAAGQSVLLNTSTPVGLACCKAYVANTRPTLVAKQFKLTKKLDAYYKNKAATAELYGRITDINLKLAVALYLEDIDKIIDTLLEAEMELTAKDIDSVIPPLNALDPDYRTSDVRKALRNINSRYTIKLYDDRATWEPILSKVRAMLDVK